MKRYRPDKAGFSISRFRDGGLVLSCGNRGMEDDLSFNAGAMDDDDPELARQRNILEYIVAAVQAFNDDNWENQDE